jgi:hypothetical protein
VNLGKVTSTQVHPLLGEPDLSPQDEELVEYLNPRPLELHSKLLALALEKAHPLAVWFGLRDLELSFPDTHGDEKLDRVSKAHRDGVVRNLRDALKPLVTLKKRVDSNPGEFPYWVTPLIDGNDYHPAYRQIETTITLIEDVLANTKRCPGPRRSERRYWLALDEALRSDDAGGTTFSTSMLADLVLASSKDWSSPPCPQMVVRYTRKSEVLAARRKDLVAALEQHRSRSRRRQ